MKGAVTVGGVVLLSPFFYPEPISTGKYNTVLAEALRDKSIPVTVIASQPLYPHWIPAPTSIAPAGIEVIRGGAWMRYPEVIWLRRLALEFWYACLLAYELPRCAANAAAVIAVIPPSLFLPLARKLFAKERPVIGIVHDLQSLLVGSAGATGKRLLRAFVRRMEGVALRSCDQLVFLSRSMAEYAVSEHGIDPERCAVHLPFVSVRMPSIVGNVLAPKFPDNYRHVVYSGALGEKQNSRRLVECLAVIAAQSRNIMCHVFSGGPLFEALRREFTGRNSLLFHDLVAEEDLAELFYRSDIQIVPQLFGTAKASLPSKLPNLIAMGVPILAICDESSEVGRITREAEAGIVLHSWDARQVSAAVVELLDLTQGQSRELRRQRMAAYTHDHFSLERLVSEIAVLVDQGKK